MDIGPAILELAGVPVPETMEAESLLPALQGEPWAEREYVFAEHGRDGILQETEFMTMVRSREWKLVHFLGEPFGQLFDLVERSGRDPQPVGRSGIRGEKARAAGRAARVAHPQPVPHPPLGRKLAMTLRS